MIINPIIVAHEGWISNIQDEEKQIQQNGIDLTLESISKLSGENKLRLDGRQHCERQQIPGDVFLLEPGCYEVLFNEEFYVPNGAAVTIHTRSTLCRGGNHIISGLYDAGFNGKGGGVLIVNMPLEIELNVRIAQAVFHEAEEGKLYQGIYNDLTTANG